MLSWIRVGYEAFAVDADSACLLERCGQSTARCAGKLQCPCKRGFGSLAFLDPLSRHPLFRYAQQPKM